MDRHLGLKWIKDLIQINSVNPDLEADGPGEYQAAQYLGKLWESWGLEVTYQEIRPKRWNVYAKVKGQSTYTTLLNGHLDTVGIQNMTGNPLSGEIKDDKIYGRGSIDMKGGLIAQSLAVYDLLSQKKKPAKSIILSAVADEEHKSIGSDALATAIRADEAIVSEPTDLAIGIAHKGYVWITWEIKGVAAHGSRYEEGVDAIMMAAKLLEAIDHLDKVVFPKRAHPMVGRPSIHASIINGGKEISVYPDSCSVQLERRTIPGENLAVVQAEMQSILDQLSKANPAFSASFSCTFSRPPLETEEKSNLVQGLMTSFNETMQTPAEIEGMSYWADSAIFCAAGMPSVLFGPKGFGLHAAEEYLDLTSMFDCAAVISNYLTSPLQV